MRKANLKKLLTIFLPLVIVLSLLPAAAVTPHPVIHNVGFKAKGSDAAKAINQAAGAGAVGSISENNIAYAIFREPVTVTSYDQYTLVVEHGPQKFTASLAGGNQTYSEIHLSFDRCSPLKLDKGDYTFNIYEGKDTSGLAVTTGKLTIYEAVYKLNGGNISGRTTDYVEYVDKADIVSGSSFTQPTPKQTGYNFTKWKQTDRNDAAHTVTYTAEWSKADSPGRDTPDDIAFNRANVTVVLSGTNNLVYTGSALKPKVTISLKDGTALKEGADYTLAYSSNINPGQAAVTITGKGRYVGAITETFTIQPLSLEGAKVKLEETSFAYTGAEIKPAVTVTYHNEPLKLNRDYTLTYLNNINVSAESGSGYATARVDGIGVYGGRVDLTFTIIRADAAVTPPVETPAPTPTGGVTGDSGNSDTSNITDDKDYAPGGSIGGSNGTNNGSVSGGSGNAAGVSAPETGTGSTTVDGATGSAASGGSDAASSETVKSSTTVPSSAASGGSATVPSSTTNGGSATVPSSAASGGSTIPSSAASTDVNVPDTSRVVSSSRGEDTKDQKTAFTDVPASAYYAGPVAWAVEKGVTNGTGGGNFSPSAPCTRAEIVTFLWRAAGSPAATGENPFTDINADSWYYDAVLWAVANGITNGVGGGAFDPGATCNRGQTVTFLWRYANQPAPAGGSSFKDVADGQYYSSAVLWAVENGITNGTGGNSFSPDATCDRGQIVTFLYRYLA